MRPGRLPVGAEVIPGEGIHFRVWAPRHARVAVEWEAPGDVSGKPASGRLDLAAESGGYHSGLLPAASAGTRYRYRVGEALRADPASRFQPEGPHGPSQVVDPTSFAWTDGAWQGPAPDDRVIYEMHLGTFTPEGTWQAAAEQLAALADLGVNVLEILPVNDFPGRFGWGYDGVNLFAPCRLYGTPDAMRAFVDRAHALGLAVILDVVYNHLGPEGNVLPEFSDDYFSKGEPTEWGACLNFDGEDSGPVREFVLANVGYWIAEFHLDGLRVDATQSLFDRSREHILAAIAARVRAAAGSRRTFVVGENEPQDVRLIRPASEGGCQLDAIWAEDFHHVAMVAATGRREGYYRDYRGVPQEFVSLARHSLVYQGQWNPRQSKRRGTPTRGLDPGAFVVFLQNHDQVANTSRGVRFHELTDPGRYRALTALLLLVPQTPMLFQGQEFAASSPFFYFGDLDPGLAGLIRRGRYDFLSQFPSLATSAMQARIARPNDPATFARSKLDPGERQRHAEDLNLHRDLLRLRRSDPVLRDRRGGGLDGAVLGPEAFVLRVFGPGAGGDDRLLIVNLGPDLALLPASEPLLAPAPGALWETRWSSEDPRYGGHGVAVLPPEENWCVTGHAAVVLGPAGDENPNDTERPTRAPR
jgi:maltooligosyltrehalose trehalohydrolase